MTIYRLARQNEVNQVATLHAWSWKYTYRGILRNQYLDHEVMEDRMNDWQKRFAAGLDKYHVIVAEANDKLIGFACTILNEDEQWGALLDNLHVLPDEQGKGIGAHLLYDSVKWVYEQTLSSQVYLTVFPENQKAIRFYERMGGIRKEKFTVDNPGGGQADVYRYVWTDLKQFVDKFDAIVKKST